MLWRIPKAEVVILREGISWDACADLDVLTDVKQMVARGLTSEDSDPLTRGLDQLLIDDHSDEVWVESQVDDVSCIIYTGGTTGPSRDVSYHTHICSMQLKDSLLQTGRTREEVNLGVHFRCITSTC